MKTQAIIPAAGEGKRLGRSKSKPLVLLNGKPILIYSLEAFERCSLIQSVIVVAPSDQVAEFKRVIKKYRCPKVKKIIAGGQERFQSVYKGLTALDKDTDFVVIHDGARPLVTSQMIEDATALCFKTKAVVAAVPVKPTIKKVDPKNLFVKETLLRDTLWEIQTPQVFEKKLILKAHRSNECCLPSDDAMLVEALGKPVKILRGDYKNIKITTAEDLVFAEAILKVGKVT